MVVDVDGEWNEKTMIGKENSDQEILGNEFLPGCTEKEGPGQPGSLVPKPGRSDNVTLRQ
jgi:hypothetical protein